MFKEIIFLRPIIEKQKKFYNEMDLISKDCFQSNKTGETFYKTDNNNWYHSDGSDGSGYTVNTEFSQELNKLQQRKIVDKSVLTK